MKIKSLSDFANLDKSLEPFSEQKYSGVHGIREAYLEKSNANSEFLRATNGEIKVREGDQIREATRDELQLTHKYYPVEKPVTTSALQKPLCYEKRSAAVSLPETRKKRLRYFEPQQKTSYPVDTTAPVASSQQALLKIPAGNNDVEGSEIPSSSFSLSHKEAVEQCVAGIRSNRWGGDLEFAMLAEYCKFNPPCYQSVTDGLYRRIIPQSTETQKVPFICVDAANTHFHVRTGMVLDETGKCAGGGRETWIAPDGHCLYRAFLTALRLYRNKNPAVATDEEVMLARNIVAEMVQDKANRGDQTVLSAILADATGHHVALDAAVIAQAPCPPMDVESLDGAKINEESALAAVQKDGRALAEVDAFLNNPEFAKKLTLTAIKQNGLAIEYVSENLVQDEEFFATLVFEASQQQLVARFLIDEWRQAKCPPRAEMFSLTWCVEADRLLFMAGGMRAVATELTPQMHATIQSTANATEFFNEAAAITTQHFNVIDNALTNIKDLCKMMCDQIASLESYQMTQKIADRLAITLKKTKRQVAQWWDPYIKFGIPEHSRFSLVQKEMKIKSQLAFCLAPDDIKFGKPVPSEFPLVIFAPPQLTRYQITIKDKEDWSVMNKYMDSFYNGIDFVSRSLTECLIALNHTQSAVDNRSPTKQVQRP